eukprot:scaffold13555_cov18-Tisochrysis_lutea.AAC.3
MTTSGCLLWAHLKARSWCSPSPARVPSNSSSSSSSFVQIMVPRAAQASALLQMRLQMASRSRCFLRGWYLVEAVAATKPNKDCIKVNICAYTIGGSTKADKGRIKADMFACVRGGSTKPNKNGINADTCACVVGGSTKQLHSERPTFVPVFTQERLQRLDPVVLLQGLAADKKPRQEYLMQAMGRGRSVGMKVSASDELGGSSTELCLVTGFFRSPGYTVSNAMVHVS